MKGREFTTPFGHVVSAHVADEGDSAIASCDFCGLVADVAIAKIIEYINTDAPAHFCPPCLDRMADHSSSAARRRRAQS